MATTTTPTTWRAERARVASLSRSRAADDPDLVSARAALATERIAEYIRRTVAAAPPLSAAQRDRLATLVRPQSDGDGR